MDWRATRPRFESRVRMPQPRLASAVSPKRNPAWRRHRRSPSKPATTRRNSVRRAAACLTSRRNLGTDGLQRAIMENTIYDPATERIVNGVRYRDPYPNNIIPPEKLDPVALKVQEYIPLPNKPGLTNNYVPNALNPRVSQVPSVKIDHSLSARLKVSGYWSRTQTDTPNNSGLDYPISVTVGQHV